MDLIILIKAFILGIVEGITEFLPISSTGHLIIAGDLLDFNDDAGKVFEVVIQLGAILAVCWEYRARLSEVALGMTQDKTAQKFILNLAIATLPAALLGFLFIKTIKGYLFTPLVVAIGFIVGGLIIFWVENRKYAPRMNDVDDITAFDALKIGLVQCLALVPGTSRSGATIIGGVYFGMSRKTATEFSFFLAIPIMFAAAFYDVYKYWDILQASHAPTFIVGFVTAFVSAFVAIRALLKFVANHNFVVFAWYRIVFGVLLLIYYRDELMQVMS